MIPPVVTQIAPGVISCLWTGLTTTDRDGGWLFKPDYPDKTVEVWGVFGEASCWMEGGGGSDSLATVYTDSDGPIRMNDSRGEGNVAGFDIKNMVVLNENPGRIRPYLTGGDGTTLLNVRVTCTARQT
jgi:hypothetical protein